VVSDFARHFGKSPDKLGPNELRTYQAYLLTECKLTPGTVVNRVAALRFFFVKTLKRHQFREFLPYPRDRRRLPTVLSREEVAFPKPCSDQLCGSNPIAHRVCRKRQRLPPSLLIENASVRHPLRPKSLRGVSDQG
jgi:hypothetical protein